MTKIEFESATIIDAIKKAARVAPSKAGTAFDQAWGILMQVTPGEEVKCLIRATNLDVFYSEVVSCIAAEGDDVVWRLPSQLLAAVLGSLPIGSGKRIKFETKGQQVLITSGRLTTTVNLGDPSYYADWDMFDPDGMSTVSGLGGRLAMVEWAADASGQPPLNAVWIDGEYLVATDRYKLVRVPMKVEVPKTIVVPAGILSSTLKAMGDTSVAVGETRLQLMPDDFTQIETVLYDVSVPNISSITRSDYPVLAEVPKNQLIEMLGRANQFAGAERSPMLKMYFGRGEVAAMMENADIGLLGDVIEVPGKLDHPRIRINFDPKYLLGALNKAPGDRVTLGYDPGKTDRFFYIKGDSGYECWIVPRKDVTTS